MNLLYLFTILYVKLTSASRYNLEFQTFSCNIEKPSLTLNLKRHSKLSLSRDFTIAFWFKYRHNRNSPILVVETFRDSVTLSVDDRRRLKVNNITSDLDELTPAATLNDFQFQGSISGWQHIALSFRTEGTRSNKVNVGIALNSKIQQPISLDAQIDLKELFLVLGSNHRYNNCTIEALYYQMYLMNSAIDLNSMDLHAISTGLAEPIFMTEFNKEPSYNKFYTNIIDSGVGDMRNGADRSTFTLFTSLSTTHNPIDRQANLANDLGVFFLPSGLLPPYQINSSYIFVIQYDFFYKDYAQASFENLYYHVLYQRMPSNGVNKLIRTDFQMGMGPNDAYAYLRYIVNDRVNKQISYQLTLERTNGLRSVPFNYLIVKVVQTATAPNPVITFINGYDEEMHTTKANFRLSSLDQHMIGDFNQQDSTRREFLSFISINEVAFYTGGFLLKESMRNSPMSFYSGIDRQVVVITCRSTNNPIRTLQSAGLIMDTCDSSPRNGKITRVPIIIQL